MAVRIRAWHAGTSGLVDRLLILALLVAMLLVGHPLPAAEAGSAALDAERDFLALANVERAKVGVGALTLRSDIIAVARRHSDRMAAQEHLHHNQTYSQEITDWHRVSENVGRGPSVASIHKALMESPGHRRNILDAKVSEAGIGVTIVDGRVWVTQNFRRPSSGLDMAPTTLTDFGDVASTNVHAASIATVASRRIADACGLARFCPTESVTRGEFASMLVRALELPATSARTFRDVSGANAADIEALAAAGLTAGCDVGRFCPDVRLSREQMATFFARALDAEPIPSPFRDTSTAHDGSVGALQARGIVNGCGASTFCARNRVTRAQTASMIANNLG